ncbi:DUF4192 domain-containing protein [Micromonospora sp. SH-82]|uniref:DUF4192 domain-containing protein n=1 Tax=Micromonospora sp. SH-82 TaxID=3132938 RepID=UPI003EB8E580
MSFPENRLTVRTPADLAAAVPYLLGFRPADGSMVVIVLRKGRVVFAARADLPAPGAPAHHLTDLGAHLIPVLQRQQPVNDVVLIGYGDPDHIDPAMVAISGLMTGGGLAVRELLRVTGARVFNLTCDDPSCCSPQGFPFDPTASLVAVQATAAGMVALPDRAAIRARFEPVRGATRAAMQKATDAALARLKAMESTGGRSAVETAGAHAVREALQQSDRHLIDDEAAWIAVLLTNLTVRDLAVMATKPHDRHVTFWAEITRRADEPLAPAPATLLAITAWRCGDGALASMAAEYALQADPAYQLAGLVLRALRVGMPPSTFDRLTGEGGYDPRNL